MHNMDFMKRQLSSQRMIQPPQQVEVLSMAQLLQKTFALYPEIAPKKGVIHIGAHKCEEATLYQSIGLKEDQTLWIDGNDDLCRQYPNIVNAVVSDKDDADVDFIITDNDAMSSSILELKLHKTEHPDCREKTRVSKKTVTLDTLLKRLFLPPDSYDFLVMDIQGAELLALKGATEILPHIQCIFTEVSVKELYAGCVMMHDLDAHLGRLNFVRIASDVNRHGWGDAIYVRRLPSIVNSVRQNVVSVEVNSGLGNRLFQLAFLYGLSREHGIKPVLMRNMIKPCPEHFTDPKRYDPFYRMFEISHFQSPAHTMNVIREPHDQPCVYRQYGKEPFYLNDKNVHLYIGYFQSEKYFAKHKPEIVQIFTQVLETTSRHVLLKYPEVRNDENVMFVHVRGRDHITTDNPQHHIAMINSYYEACLERISTKPKFLVFTDDVQYLMSLKFVNRLGNYTIVLENELDSLYLMSQCRAGGICTNSTFSWWSSYLNTNPAKQVFMPYPFLNGQNVGFADIYYDGVQQIRFDEKIRGVFDDVLNVRFVEEEVIVTVVQKKDYPLLDVLIDKTRATIQKFDKPVHQDIYSTFYAITAKNPSWRSDNELQFTMTINGIQKEFHVKKTPIKKYGLVSMTMFKDDVSLIPSYVTYYRKMGIEHFYMYYNDVNPITTLPQFHDVTYIQWNYPYYNRDNENTHYSQVGALTDFLYWSKHFADYVLFNDLDEYIFWKGPKDLSLKRFVAQNKFAVYGFLNNFVHIKSKNTEVVPDDDMYKMIENGEFDRTHIVYEYGKRSKCIVDPRQISCMGVHKTILPSDVAKCVLGFVTAGIFHVCNIKERVHVSITKDFLNRIS